MASVATGRTAVASPPQELCTEAARDAIAPAEAVIDEHVELTIEEWNGLEPPPDLVAVQQQIDLTVLSIVQQGCSRLLAELTVNQALDDLRDDSPIAAVVVAELRAGQPTAPGRRANTRSHRFVRPGEDLVEILHTVGRGSTVTLASGTFNVADTIIIDTDIELVGAGRGDSTITSSAPGVALAFIGPGDLTVRDLALRHVGDQAASVLLAIEGSVTLRRVEVSGGVAVDDEAGHGVVLAFENLTGLPSRTAEQRVGEVVVEDVVVTGNDAAGILVTGDAAPRISASTIVGNGQCGVCYSGAAAGTLDRSTIEDNAEIGVQVLATSHPTIEASTLRGHGLGVLVGDTASVTISESTITDSEVAVRAVDSGRVEAAGNTVSGSVAAVSFIDEATGTLQRNDVASDGQVAVEVAGSAAVDVDHNLVRASGVGISFIESGSGRAFDNVVRGREIGIQVGGTAAPTLVDNEVLDSRMVGILFAEESAGWARRNHVAQLDGTGIQVGGSSTPDVASNDVRGGVFGMVYLDDAGGRATLNRFVNHTVGIQLYGSAAAQVTGNEFTRMRDAAIVFSEDSVGEAAGNECAGESGGLIAVAATASPILGSNDCEIWHEGVDG